ncbi:oxidoreductase [Actinoallomurus sp. NPDC050550]|uniref:oxidoreductase n=1 Tax=Actinoallomurus sp. NPDC050550 TaxID=3154937 RepID=UPI0033FD4AA8
MERDQNTPAGVDEELTGRRVLVTGGSRGLGAAIVRRFHAAGATVLAAARKPPEEDLPATFIAADLATADGAADLARQVIDHTGGVDILVNNAGGGSAPEETLRRTEETWEADLHLNLLSAVRMDRHLVPGMVERGTGVVVHVSSIASHLPPQGQAAYAAAKAALNAYSRLLAVELGPAGVRVVCVLPGFIPTPGAIAQHRKYAENRGVTLEQVQRDLATSLNVPMAKPGRPEDAAELVTFLASSRARWLTGAQYRVDGGIIPVV